VRHADAITTALLPTAAVAMVLAAGLGAAGIVSSTGPAGALSTALFEAAIGLFGLLLVGRVSLEEATTDRDPFTLSRRDVGAFLSVAVAAPVTRLAAVEAGLGAVVAAALVGLLAESCCRFGVPAYCGAFVGMAGPGLFPTLAAVLAAGLVAGLVYIAAKRVFNGFGGKLGTLAFLGCSAVVLATGASYPAGSLPDPPMAAAAILAAVAGAGGTYYLSVERDKGPVVGSAVVGLVAGLLAPPLLGPLGGPVAAAAFCASFVGMSRPDRLDGPALVLAGGVSGLLFVGAQPLFVASGGKLGTLAFAACLLVDGAGRVGEDLPVEVPTPT
jgi:hypothetical protein